MERPVPKENEVLVRVRATTVTRSDCGHRGASPFFSRFFTGLRRPKQPIVGMELAGIVEEVGSAVTGFAVGDEVFGLRSGANAEYVCVREAGALAHKPESLSFEEAAALADGAMHRARVPREGGARAGEAHPRLWRVRGDRHRRRPAREGDRR